MRQSAYPMISVDRALALVLEHTAPLPAVQLPLAEALDLVLAEAVHADRDHPPFPAATVDGFALRAADGHGPRRLLGDQMAGMISELAVEPGTAVRITTGAPVPSGADAVVMVEHADEAGDQVIPHGGQALQAGQGVRPVGSDVRAGTVVLAAGSVLGPPELGVLASLGRSTAPVHRRPVVGVFSTGDELVEPGSELGPGQIWDSNRTTLLAAAAQAGAIPLDLGIIPDAAAELERRIAAGLVAADLLVTSGGVSMGELDLLKPLLERWGRVHFGRVRMKPGKPLTFAILPAPGNDSSAVERPVFALPGNPVSSLVTFQLFVRPAIRRMLGFSATGLPSLTARLGHDLVLDPQRPEFHRVTLSRAGDEVIATSTGSQASSRLLSVAGAHGLLCLEQGSGTLPAGTERKVLIVDEGWLVG